MINGHIASAIVATPQHFLPSKGAAFALNGVLVTCVQRGGGGGEGVKEWWGGVEKEGGRQC